MFDPNKARKCPGPVVSCDSTTDPNEVDREREHARKRGYRFKSGERAMRFDGQNLYRYCWVSRSPRGINCRAREYRYPPCPECGATDLTCGEDCPLEQAR